MIEQAFPARGAARLHPPRRSGRTLRRASLALLAGALGGAAFDIGTRSAGAALTLVLLVTGAAAALLIGLRVRAALEERRVRTLAAHDDVAALAHDLRAPMVTLRTYLELLASDALGPLSSEAHEAAGRAGTAAVRAQSMVDSLLLSYAESTATGVAPAPRAGGAGVGAWSGGRAAPGEVDLEALLDEVTGVLAVDIASCRARIDVEPLPVVRGETSPLFRVFLNLLQNSLRHLDPQVKPHVVVSATAREDMWEITVRDNGPGVPASLREQVFEPGMRGPASAARPGFGLGLSTVRRLVAEQGGRVWIDVSVPSGACFCVALPAAPKE